MENDLKELRRRVVKFIEKLDEKGILGAIPYLETCEEMFDAVEEELEQYEGTDED
jgi:hypothetical protein